MGKTNNTRKRSNDIQEIAQSLVDQEMYDKLPLGADKPLRVVWQKQLIEKTGCTPFTARSHIAKALRRMRYKNKENNS